MEHENPIVTHKADLATLQALNKEVKAAVKALPPRNVDDQCLHELSELVREITLSKLEYAEAVDRIIASKNELAFVVLIGPDEIPTPITVLPFNNMKDFLVDLYYARCAEEECDLMIETMPPYEYFDIDKPIVQLPPHFDEGLRN